MCRFCRSAAAGISLKSHREISRGAVLIFENFNPLVALCHAEEITLDVGLTLLDQSAEIHFENAQ